MLVEAYTWLRTSCPRNARRLGYLSEAIALQARARRCRNAWAAHIDCCHDAVRRSLAQCSGNGTALVLGSGLALEYPLAQLAQRFQRVVLADLVHLPAMRRTARYYANVELLECDLTGALGALALADGNTTNADLDAMAVSPPSLRSLGAIDWALSCNLLSQLPLRPVAWLRRQCPRIGDHALARLAHRLVSAHLEWLATLAAHNCLIADAEQTTFDATGGVAEHNDFAQAFGLDAKSFAAWDWQLAPDGELGGGLTARHRVVACRL